MDTPQRITTIDYADHHCLHMCGAHGAAIISLHGAQLLSWVPAGQNEVFWLSPRALPEPAAIRGGVPVCWPWFASQGMPIGAMSHGPVRNRLWEVAATDHGDFADANQPLRITLTPTPALTPDDPLCRYAAGLQVSLSVELGDTLTQTLTTHNWGEQPFVLTEALHSYFAVTDAGMCRSAVWRVGRMTASSAVHKMPAMQASGSWTRPVIACTSKTRYRRNTATP
jgi:glucose-6-phosphate 1-epimerase